MFYYLTYENGCDLSQIEDPVLRHAAEDQIASFGQTPAMLFTQPHPARKTKPSAGRLQDSTFQELQARVTRVTPGLAVAFLAGGAGTLLSVSSNQCFSVHKMDSSERVLVPDAMLGVAGGGSWRRLGEPFEQSIIMSPALFSVSSDAALIAVCGYWDSSVQLFDASGSGRHLQSLFGHGDVATCVAFCPSGRALATGGRDSTVLIWQRGGGWGGGMSGVSGVSGASGAADGGAGADGGGAGGGSGGAGGMGGGGADAGTSSSAGASSAGTGDLFQASPVALLVGHDHPVHCVAMDTELDLVVSGGGSVCLLHRCSGELVGVLEHPQARKVHLVAITAAGQIVVHFADKARPTLALFSASGRLVASAVLDEALLDMVVDIEGHYVLGAGFKRELKVWRLCDMQRVHCYTKVSSSIRSVGLSKDNSVIYAGLSNGEVVTYTK